jgi:multisubunit Na+/H+ antiporter MnhE subunit
MIGSRFAPVNEASPSASRKWSWAALVWAVLFGAVSIPTFGLGVVLAPVGVALSAMAWRRAPHNSVFWVGATLNGLAALGLLAVLIGLLTGDVGIGLD